MPDTSAKEARRTESPEPRGVLTVRVSAMPADTNANGDIFGGWVLSRMDQAGGIAAVERAQGRVVTIALDAMTFIRPVRVGDVLEVYTEVESIGRTSMKVHVDGTPRGDQCARAEVDRLGHADDVFDGGDCGGDDVGR